MTQGKLPELADIYAAFHAKVLAYASKLLGRAEAEDVAQEVFVKVGRALGSLIDPAKLSPWIYAITLNTVRDVVRKRATRVGRLSSTENDARADAEGESLLARVADTASRSPEETAIHNEMIACYLEYVSRLPARYYEVYVLREFEHLSFADIAGRLGISLGAAKIRLHRAREQLYEELRQNCSCYRNERGELMGEPKNTQAGCE